MKVCVLFGGASTEHNVSIVSGTSVIKIKGVDKLSGCFHEVIPDRIEAGTYSIIGALIGSKIKIDNIIPEHLEALTSKMKEIGVNINIKEDYFEIEVSDNYKKTNIKTMVFPGFPTDLQQPFTVLLTQCDGKSSIHETIWENRFMHIEQLNKMGANITVNGTKAFITGKTPLRGTTVKATDLRAGAAMVCAALIADGETIITNAEHILRGYENIVNKLSDVGAKIEIIEI